jgi:hypothetical protein
VPYARGDGTTSSIGTPSTVTPTARRSSRARDGGKGAMDREHADLGRLLAALQDDPDLRRALHRDAGAVLARFDLEHLRVPKRPVEALQRLDERLSPSAVAGVLVGLAAEGLSLEHHVAQDLGADPVDARLAAKGEPDALRRITSSFEAHLAAPADHAAHASSGEHEPRSSATGESAHALPAGHLHQPPPEDEPPPSPADVPYEREIDAAARRYHLDAAVLKGLIKQESDFDPNAVSPAGAVGLCQLMPGTAQALGVEDPTDPEQSIEGGAKYLREMLDMFDGHPRLALAAYNAGPAAVMAHGGVPDYPETQDFVERVFANARGYRSGHSDDPRAGAADFDRAPRRTGILYLKAGRSEAGDDADLVLAHAASADAPGDETVAALKSEAERIDDAQVAYQWGGGHAGRLDPDSAVTPLDCSGAVSRVLGIDPRVSGAFANWGEPGSGERVSIYYNAQHVFMVIDGHFFGTSRSNPGGGPGWIPRALITPNYLAKFDVRHPPGL